MAEPKEPGLLDPLTTAYELGEARAELARHQQDFERISKLLDKVFDTVTERTSTSTAMVTMAATLGQIRSIVG